jgi:hypothetical protein
MMDPKDGMGMCLRNAEDHSQKIAWILTTSEFAAQPDEDQGTLNRLRKYAVTEENDSSAELWFSNLFLVSVFIFLGWGETEPIWYVTGLMYQPRTIDNECGAVGGIRIARVIRSTLRKPASVPLCPPQIPHDLTWARNRAAAVGSRRLTV